MFYVYLSCMFMHSILYMWRSEDRWQKFSLSTMWVPGIKLRSSGFGAVSFIHWTTSLCLPSLLILTYNVTSILWTSFVLSCSLSSSNPLSFYSFLPLSFLFSPLLFFFSLFSFSSPLFIKICLFLILCMSILFTCRLIFHVCAVPKDPRRGSQNPLKLGLETVVSHTFDAKNQIWIV